MPETAVEADSAKAMVDAHNSRVASLATQNAGGLPAEEPLPFDSPERKTTAITDAWEKSPFYQPPPSSLCLWHNHHDSPLPTGGGPDGSIATPLAYDCWVAQFDTLTLPTFQAKPNNYNAAEFPGTGWMCEPATWGITYQDGGPDPSLQVSISPSVTGQGNTNCRRYDPVVLSFKRTAKPTVTVDVPNAAGVYQLCDSINCASGDIESYVSAQFIQTTTPPPPCVAFFADAYAAAMAAHLDPTLFGSIPAKETGGETVDDGRDIYQYGRAVNAGGVCTANCGVGPWQVDPSSNPGYTGGTGNASANATAAASIWADALKQATNYLGPSATQSQIIVAAGDYYNAGGQGMRNPAYTTHDHGWPDTSSLDYGTALLRHYQRILDYKLVCPYGQRG